MATPIAHKGVTAGAKVQAMTMIDLLTRPALVQDAWDYFRNVQTKEIEVRAAHPAAGQARHRAEQGDDGQVPRRRCSKYYYDPSKYKTYLEQLGIQYPTVKK